MQKGGKNLVSGLDKIFPFGGSAESKGCGGAFLNDLLNRFNVLEKKVWELENEIKEKDKLIKSLEKDLDLHKLHPSHFHSVKYK